MKKLNASEKAKAAGFKSLQEVAQLLTLHVNTLGYRSKNMPEVFEADLKRAKELKENS